MRNNRRNRWKKGAVLALAAAMAATAALPLARTTAYAASDGDYETKETYLSLGADLKDSERAAVYELLGLAEGEIPEDQIQYVTNEEEHAYLDSYLSAATIGSRSLSSVLVTKSDQKGIHVTTKNISYCTEGMYENALATAGAKDVDVVVAGPFEISGTAALVGAIKAYGEKTGEEISSETVDAAIDEMITTGELSDSIGAAIDGADVTNEDVEGMIAWLKEEIASGNDKDLDQLIADGEEKYGVSLSDDEKAKLKELLEKLASLDLDVKTLTEQAENLYNKLNDMGLDVSSEEAKGIFAKIIAFFQGLLNR